jgi:hypothetical protein
MKLKKSKGEQAARFVTGRYHNTSSVSSMIGFTGDVSYMDVPS